MIFNKRELIGSDHLDIPRETCSCLTLAISVATARFGFDPGQRRAVLRACPTEAPSLVRLLRSGLALLASGQRRQPVGGLLPVHDAEAETDLSVTEIRLQGERRAFFELAQSLFQDVFEIVGRLSG